MENINFNNEILIYLTHMIRAKGALYKAKHSHGPWKIARDDAQRETLGLPFDPGGRQPFISQVFHGDSVDNFGNQDGQNMID